MLLSSIAQIKWIIGLYKQGIFGGRVVTDVFIHEDMGSNPAM